MKKLTGKTLVTGMFLCCILTALFLIIFNLLSMQSQDQKVYKMILIPKTIDEKNGFWTSLIAGAELGAEEFKADLEITGGKSETDIEGQIKCIQDSIAKKPDAMLVSPCSYSEMSEALQKVVDNGIKLVLIDSVIDRDIAQGIVATDNYLAGRELGEFTRGMVTDQSQIGIVAHVKGSSTAIERENGMREGLGEYENQIMDVVFCGSSYDRAYKLTADMLEKYPKMEVIMGTNEYSAVGAARAVKDLGLKGKVKVVGFDNSIEEIQLLEKGVFQGIIIQKPFNMGYLGVEQAVHILDGKKYEKNVDSGCKMITKENMYEEENQRLLYPFTGQQ